MDGYWYPCPLRVSSQQISVHSHSLRIAMNSFFRMAMGSTPNCFSSSMVSAKNACMCIGWWISCRLNPDKDLPLACQACRIRLQRCDLDRMCSQDLCQTPDGAIRPGSSLPSLNAQMIKRHRYLRFDPDSTLLYAQMWTTNKNALGCSKLSKSPLSQTGRKVTFPSVR